MSISEQQAAKIRNQPGFIAALDQSGGSTPKALKLYGIEENTYSGEQQMMDLVHQMRTRIVSSPSFGGNRGGSRPNLGTPSQSARPAQRPSGPTTRPGGGGANPHGALGGSTRSTAMRADPALLQ